MNELFASNAQRSQSSLCWLPQASSRLASSMVANAPSPDAGQAGAKRQRHEAGLS